MSAHQSPQAAPAPQPAAAATGGGGAPKDYGYRADFIKTLFGVATSVGFVNRLIESTWFKESRLPNDSEYGGVIFLMVGLTAVISSWEGYFASLNEKPLNGIARFIIDILIVFAYMFLLLSSDNADLFFTTLAGIFVLYILWDIFLLFDYPNQYGRVPGECGIRYAVRTYFFGLFDSKHSGRGRAITLLWSVAILFICYVAIEKALYEIIVGGFLFLSLIVYRVDKAKRFRSPVTAILVAGIIATFAIYAYGFA